MPLDIYNFHEYSYNEEIVLLKNTIVVSGYFLHI